MQTVNYDEFKKIDMRIVQVLSAEHIPGRSKILKLVLDIGGGETRTVIAGGAQYYKPEDFIGKKFVAVVNLAAKTVAGVTSEGMILATNTEKPLWLTVDPSAPVGSRVV
jgi:tRNA-binding protein